jgi:hypothetical protein
LLAEGSLHSDCLRIVVGDEPPVGADTLRGTRSLVDLLLGSSPWKCVVFEGTVLPATATILVSRTADVEEASPEEGDSQEYLLPRNPGRHHELDSRSARRLVLVHRIELRMVATLGCPRTVEVVGIQVESIEVFGASAQVDVLENLSRGGEGSSNQKTVLWKMDPGCRQQSQKVSTLSRGAWVLPDNWTMSASLIRRRETAHRPGAVGFKVSKNGQ